MFRQTYSSSLLEDAVDSFASLPGIGRKTALRLALHILQEPEANVEKFASSLLNFRTQVQYCPQCGIITDDGECPICNDRKRDRSIVCVVESFRDVLSIENTGSYHGLYHILGGIISPLDGIGPGDLRIASLMQRCTDGEIREVVLALSTGMEGETTSFYLYRQLANLSIAVSTIARGVAFGDDLEYTDELTLGKAIENRRPFKI